MAREGIYKRGGQWWYRFQLDGKIYAGNSEAPTKSAAKLVRAQKMVEAYRELGIRKKANDGPVEILDAIEVWQAQSDRLKQEYSTVRRFAAWLGEGHLLEDVSVKDVSEWRLARRQEVADTTVLRDFASCSAFFTWAMRGEYCTSNPFRVAEKPDGAWTPPPPLSRQGVADVLKEVESHPIFGPAYHLAYWAGMRRGELCRMTTKDIRQCHTTDGYPIAGKFEVLVPGTKTKRARGKVPVLPEFQAYLDKHWSGEGHRLHMVSEFKDAPIVPNRLSKLLIFTNEQREKNGLFLLPNLHRMRHSIGAHLIESGYKVHEVASFLRNSIRMVEKVYGHFSASTFRDRFDSFRL